MRIRRCDNGRRAEYPHPTAGVRLHPTHRAQYKDSKKLHRGSCKPGSVGLLTSTKQKPVQKLLPKKQPNLSFIYDGRHQPPQATYPSTQRKRAALRLSQTPPRKPEKTSRYTWSCNPPVRRAGTCRHARGGLLLHRFTLTANITRVIIRRRSASLLRLTGPCEPLPVRKDGALCCPDFPLPPVHAGCVPRRQRQITPHNAVPQI